MRAETKSNEITAIPKLLELLSLQGALVTIDAAGAQTNIAQQIHDAKGDYVLGLKGNQGRTFNETRAYWQDAQTMAFEGVVLATHQSEDSGHGRHEVRVVRSTPVPDTFNVDEDRWAGLKTLVMVERTRTIDGQQSSHEASFYITSLPFESVARIGHAIRAQRGCRESFAWVSRRAVSRRRIADWRGICARKSCDDSKVRAPVFEETNRFQEELEVEVQNGTDESE